MTLPEIMVIKGAYRALYTQVLILILLLFLFLPLGA
jgi:hypothetical protein